jgi:transcriptional regulator with XRE-family HTH domain
METLKKIIKLKKLGKRELAEALFPDAKHPLMTLNRVLSDERPLSVEEFKILAEITDIPIGFLITEKWDITADCLDFISFSKGDITCEAETSSWVVRVYKFAPGGRNLVYKVQAQNAPLKVFLSDVTDLIIQKSSNKLINI